MTYRFNLPVYKKSGLIILTSFKVMYSFLESQKEWKRIFWNKDTFHLALSNRLANSPKAIALYRHPETRFISYFKDKFRKEPQRMIAENRLQLRNLQRCQRLWLNSIEQPLDDVEACCHRLLEAPVDGVIEWLPTTYKEDVHTLPQTYCNYARWKSFRVKLNIAKSFSIDCRAQLDQFRKIKLLSLQH